MEEKIEYQIIQINHDTWRIEDGGVRFFLLTGSQKALLIDSGMNVHQAREIAASLTDLPLALLITHADVDHIGSNEEFDTFYMHPSEAAHYYHKRKTPTTFMAVYEGDILDLGDRKLEIIALPGHTPGSIAVLDHSHRCLISGDPIQDGEIYMFGGQREMHAYIQSLQRLQKRIDAFDEIFPSHGSFPIKPAQIEVLLKGAQRVLSGKAVGTHTEVHGTPVLKFVIGNGAFLCDDI